MGRVIFDGEVKVVDKVKPRRVKRSKAIKAAAEKAYKEINEAEKEITNRKKYAAGLELPDNMEIKIQDGKLYFLSDNPKDFKHLSSKLKQVELAMAIFVQDENLV